MINYEPKATNGDQSSVLHPADEKQLTSCRLDIRHSVMEKIRVSRSSELSDKLKMHLQVINKVIHTQLKN